VKKLVRRPEKPLPKHQGVGPRAEVGGHNQVKIGLIIASVHGQGKENEGKKSPAAHQTKRGAWERRKRRYAKLEGGRCSAWVACR